MIQSDRELHVKGLSRFTDDAPHQGLHCCLFLSPIARGKIISLNTEPAAACQGVVKIITSEDIPGQNQIGTIIEDEPLLAEKQINYMGQPLAAVYARSEREARLAIKKIELKTKEEPPLLDPRRAFEKNQLIAPKRTFSMGDVEKALKDCAYTVTGRADSGGQEHFYLECQTSRAWPMEGGNLKIQSSTQSTSAIQKVAARVCGLPMHKVEVDVRRLGGAFGGKEDQATPWACFAALGALICQQPTRLVLRRNEDMLATGKRHPYSSDFTLGLDKEGKIMAYRAMFYQNAGAAADLSTAILERSLFHCTASYYIPNVEVSAASCRCNMTPFTAFRGFGGPQAMFVIESALREASRITGIAVEELQRINLIKEGDSFVYGQKAEGVQAEACWNRAQEKYQLKKSIEQIKKQKHSRYRKGYSLMPVCFGISFTHIALNQARALIHIYTDGSVGVSTGAIEMGQGVNLKIGEIVSLTLGLPLDRIKIESTNTTRIANSSPTAASTGSDLNGKAAQMACEKILSELFRYFSEKRGCNKEDLSLSQGSLYQQGDYTGINWEQMIEEAYEERLHLSAEAHYSTPDLHFDSSREKGRPFAYHSYGTAYAEVTLDSLLGTYNIDCVKIAHDSGRNIDSLIDLGQVEGGLAQGIGWLTLEELSWNEKGRPLTATAGSYKLPDLFSVPNVVECEFLKNAENPRAVLNSKAVGEPPFMYALAVYFALRQAAAMEGSPYQAPLTPERLFMELSNQGS